MYPSNVRCERSFACYHRSDYHNGPVAQLVRAPPCHGGGRGFEPHPGRLRKQNYIWDLSSAGRASALQAEGHRFEPCRSHILIKYGGIAQLARAHGSYPWCRWFKSSSRYYNEDCVLKKLVRSLFTQIYWLLLISSKEIIVLRSNLW